MVSSLVTPCFYVAYSSFLRKHTRNKPLHLFDVCYCYIALPVAGSINVVVTRYPLSASIAITFMVRSHMHIPLTHRLYTVKRN